MWGEATLINPRSGYASSYMATVLVGFAAQDERATTANNATVAEALAAASGGEKAILWVQWTADPQSGASTHVVLTFPGGHQPGADDPIHLSMPHGEEHEHVTLQQMALPNVVNVCTLAHVGERTTGQCPAVERGEPGAILIGIGAR